MSLIKNSESFCRVFITYFYYLALFFIGFGDWDFSHGVNKEGELDWAEIIILLATILDRFIIILWLKFNGMLIDNSK